MNREERLKKYSKILIKINDILECICEIEGLVDSRPIGYMKYNWDCDIYPVFKHILETTKNVIGTLESEFY